MSTADTVLGPGGLIASRLGGYEDRPQQLAMARAVENALQQGRHLVVEAGTGVGKSFAYLAPAILRSVAGGNDDKPVVISTGTIALQEQLYGKDIPFLRGIWDHEFTAVLAKGRGNYVSLRRLEKALSSEVDQRRELQRIKAWAENTPDGTRGSMEFEPEGEAWQMVVSDRNNCLGRQCANYEKKCFYQQARRRLFNANILVVNHALLCADLALKSAGVNYLPDYKYLIIDEAHDLERYASEHLGLRITRASVNYGLSQVFNAKRQKGLLTRYDHLYGAHEGLRRAKDETERFFLLVENWMRDQRQQPARMREAELFPHDAADALRALSGRLQEGVLATRNEVDRGEIESHVKRIEGYAVSLDSFNRQSLEGQVYWVERGGRNEDVELRAAPIHVGELMEKLLFKRCKSVVLTSATLATGPEDFRYISNRLGVPALSTDFVQVGSPFNYRERAQIVIPDLPEPPRAGGQAVEYDARINEEVTAAVRRSRGGTFVLFTSFQQLRKVYEAVRAPLEFQGYTLLRQGEGMSRGRMLESFKSGEKMVLFGVETFWQGVDVPGEALTTVVLARLPFPVPSDPLVAARMEDVARSGGSDFNDYMVPEATIKLRQGFGRLIRRQDDFGTVVILDSRVVRKGYGKKILRALPDCPVTDGKGGQPGPAKKQQAANPFEL